MTGSINVALGVGRSLNMKYNPTEPKVLLKDGFVMGESENLFLLAKRAGGFWFCLGKSQKMAACLGFSPCFLWAPTGEAVRLPAAEGRVPPALPSAPPAAQPGEPMGSPPVAAVKHSPLRNSLIEMGLLGKVGFDLGGAFCC